MARESSSSPGMDSKPIGKSSSKNAKPVTRDSNSKRGGLTLLTGQHGAAAVDKRLHRRVRKACERCRIKKTKCDGDLPCKRCKLDGLVCIAGRRKKGEHKEFPPKYAEVLEDTQHILISTIHKLYARVRNGESWNLGEPELDDRGLPVVHDIAEKLGCVRPSFDEETDGFAELQTPISIPDELQATLSQYSTFPSETQLSWNQQQPSQDPNDGILDQQSHILQSTQERQSHVLPSNSNQEPQFDPQSSQTPIFHNPQSYVPSSSDFLTPHHNNIHSILKTQAQTQQENLQHVQVTSSSEEHFAMLATDLQLHCPYDENVKQEMPDCFMGFDVAADIG
ncbi:Fluconazole resistance protein 1 [Lachnellula cervina]|uniref:Fluconazole resistance protein 1 n=1 Tax=Lachnellula cervina TaxID=1316786 RepID=A0A7D8UUI5_9HELO|nr:Fluconazole resistance protein 1 [Lachnellula cervina]